MLRDAIEVKNARFASAVRRGNHDIAGQLYSPGATLVPSDMAPLGGRERIADYWRAGIAAGLSGADFQIERLHADGGVVIEIGTYRLRAGEMEVAVREAGTRIAVSRRQHDGTWHTELEIFEADNGAGR